MPKPIAIIAGEPNSISSEIIFKCWKYKKKYTHKPFFIIGSINLLKQQSKKLNYNIKFKKINKDFSISELRGNVIPIYNIDYKQKSAFEKITKYSNNYIFKSFETVLFFLKNKKISGFINCPVAKETLFSNKYQGITEFISNSVGLKGKEVMLIYNKKLSVSPLTTHIPLNKVNNKIKQRDIIAKIKTINNFYIKTFKKKPNIAILGLNPHNFSNKNFSEEKKIIEPAIKKLKKFKLRITGPVSPDTSFVNYDKKKIDVIFGMYHDQVLTPFKALFKYNAINITLGLPFVRISPDHGIGSDIIGKKIANPKSLIESIKFFNNFK